MAKSKYKVGDTVTIKQLLKEHCSNGSYRFGLNSDMVALSGESYTIASVEHSDDAPGKIPDDGYRYRLDGAPWSWASSMFEDSSEPSFTQCIIERDCSIDAFIKKNECPVLDFSL